MILQNQDLHNRKGSRNSVAREWAGGSSATPYFLAAYFAKRNTNLGGGGSEGGAGIHFPHTPFSARPARANWLLAREARHQFRSKKVRAFSNKGHQTGLRDFLRGEAEERSPRLRVRLARNWAAKSNGGTKSQETIFSEMRRFVITKLCIKINFYSNFLRKISRFAGLRQFFIPSPNISRAKI